MALSVSNSAVRLDSTAGALEFVLACQKPKGGFGKFTDADVSADPLHTYFSLAGLSLWCEQNWQPTTLCAIAPPPSPLAATVHHDPS
jgi:prenyltransferase beta subunit